MRVLAERSFVFIHAIEGQHQNFINAIITANYEISAIAGCRCRHISSSSNILGFYHLSRFRCLALGCWVYYENTLPSSPRSEYRPSVPCGGSRA